VFFTPHHVSHWLHECDPRPLLATIGSNSDLRSFFHECFNQDGGGIVGVSRPSCHGREEVPVGQIPYTECYLSPGLNEASILEKAWGIKPQGLRNRNLEQALGALPGSATEGIYSPKVTYTSVW
jgi:hypothetical protein